MIALVLMSQHAVFGNTITASSASASDVQTAINFANDGDTVIVPPGNVTWSTAVTINGKAITLQGSGTASTIINNGIAGGSDLVINPPTNGKWLTVSGFRFNAHPTAGASGSTGMIHISGDGYWRLCSNYVEIGYTGIVQYGNGGLIDHNFFNADFGNGGNPTGFYHLGNNNIWLTTIKYGTVTNWTYVEHNVFTWDSGWGGANGADDGGEGNATCFRYNIVTNTWTGCHGPDSSGKTASSTFGGEYYSNTFFNGIGGNIDTAMSARGGTGLFWGNTLRGLANNNYNQIVKLRYYRWSVPGGYSDWPSFPASIDGWLIVSGTYAGWPAYMQQGYTGPIQGVDVNTGNNIGGATTCTEVSSPIYVWGNQTIGVSASTVVAADSLIFLNTNYFLSGPPSGYTPLVDPYPLGGSTQSSTNPPQITAQPINASVVAGQTATFSVTASGSGTLTYQWYWYGTNIPGATSSSWTTPPTVPGNSNSIVYVNIGNAYGSLNSTNAYLYVTSGVAPAIITNPASQTIAAGGSAVFTVTASGTTPMAYQWRFNSAAIAGATNRSYTVAPVGTNNAGGYSTKVTNNYGSVTSLVAALTVTSSTQTIHYYYVAPNGNDANNGSIGSPWATVNHATASMAGGDVLYIRGGTYSQIFDIYGPSGSANNPTMVLAYPGETPVFNHNDITSQAHSIDRVNWMVVGGLTIMSNNIGMVVGVLGTCNNVTLTNMVFEDIGQQGLQFESNSFNCQLLNSTIHDTGLWIYNGEGVYIGQGGSALDNTHDIIIQGCTIYNTADEGIELKPGTYNITVRSNTIYSANLPQNSYGAGGGAIEVDEEGTVNYSPGNPNQIIAGNTVYNTVIGIRGGTGGTYYNNVIYGCSSYGMLINNANSPNAANTTYPRLFYNNTVDNSPGILYNSGAYSILNNIGYTGPYNLADSPAYFVNAAAHNYNLVAGSAPIGNGTNLYSVFNTDFAGNPRPNGAFDIGAYQYTGTNQLPLPPPTNLHIVSSQ